MTVIKATNSQTAAELVEQGWEVIDVYSRAQAIADGVQLEANPETREEAGIKFPVFLTRSVYDRYVKVPEGFDGMQQEDARLWDVFTMFRHAARNADSNFIQFKVSVLVPGKTYLPNERRQPEMSEGKDWRVCLVTLHSVIGPLDFDDPRPAITIMLPGED
jgi:hypothetical protein